MNRCLNNLRAETPVCARERVPTSRSGSCIWRSRCSRHRKEAILARYLLKLYITGSSPRTEIAIANLRRICEEDLSGQYSLDIIDVQEKPELAESDRILATPTLIKQLPPPLRRVIGDLSDRDKVLLGLELRPKDQSEEVQSGS